MHFDDGPIQGTLEAAAWHWIVAFLMPPVAFWSSGLR